MPPTNAQKKKKSKTKKTTPAPAITKDGLSVQEQTPAPESSPPLPDTPAPEPFPPLPERPEINPSRELLYLALSSWRLSRFQGMIYKIERTFAHHRLDEVYGTHIIFEQLDHLNQGKHAELLEEMNSFCDTVMDEFDDHLARKGDNS